jgi:FixJ family two-component response regulator
VSSRLECTAWSCMELEVISIVDDDVSVRRATVDLLSSAGFDCEAFASGDEYLQSGRIGDTTCLILDITMPGMTGLDLQRHLTGSGYSIPIIFVTGYPEDSTRDQAFRGGAICYLPKPCAEEKLFSCIDRALGQGDA